MDFSLVQAQSRHPGLRDILALKKRWPYYGIMVVDPILRFSWIFYAIFTHNTQHSTLVSFMVAFMEVARRGMWSLFRVENEHCANVAQYKASRDVPLPYRIEPLMDHASADSTPMLHPQESQGQATANQGSTGQATGASTTAGGASGSLRRRPDTVGGKSFSRILAEAHKQDFEKKRKPAGEQSQVHNGRDIPSDEDEDEDEDDYEVREANELRHRENGDDV